MATRKGNGTHEQPVRPARCERIALVLQEWIAIPPQGAGIVVYNVHREYDRWREEGLD